MISTVFLKSTVRPWPSVRRPSSITCSSTLKTSLWAFSISSSRTTRVRAPAHGLGELAALLVADVAGRRADEPRDGVLLHVLGHVDADHRVLGVEHELGQRAGQLGLADAGRAEEQERADRAVGVAQARRASGAARRETAVDGLVLADHALVQALLHVDELLDLALDAAGRPGCRSTCRRPRRSPRRRRARRDRPAARSPPRAVLGVLQALLEVRDLAVAQLGGALVVELALGALELAAGLVEALAQLAVALGLLLLALPLGAHAGRLLAQVGELALDLVLARRSAVSSLPTATISISSCLIRRSTSSISVGTEESSIATRRRGLVDEVDRLVGQEAVGDVAVATASPRRSARRR